MGFLILPKSWIRFVIVADGVILKVLSVLASEYALFKMWYIMIYEIIFFCCRYYLTIKRII